MYKIYPNINKGKEPIIIKLNNLLLFLRSNNSFLNKKLPQLMSLNVNLYLSTKNLSLNRKSLILILNELMSLWVKILKFLELKKELKFL